jgi:hypothetical protein
MKIFTVERKRPFEVGYDEASGFVVIAEDVVQAAAFASMEHGDEGMDFWLLKSKTVIKEIGEATAGSEPGVVLRDFNAG